MEDKLNIRILSKEKNKEVLSHFAHLLPQDMVGVNCDWEFVGALYDGVPCGILAYIVDDEIVIPWIYVDETYRRRAVGSRMLETLRNDLEDRLLFMGFSCEIVLDQEGGGLDLIEFFSTIEDMDIEPRYCIYKISPSEYRKTFEEHPLFKGNQAFVAQRLIDIPDNQKIAFMSIPKVADCYQIDQISKWREGIEEDLSLCILDDDKVTSAIILTDMGEDILSVELIYASGMESLTKLLIAFGQALMEKGNGKSLIFRAVNDKIMEFTEKLFSEIEVCCEVWEASNF